MDLGTGTSLVVLEKLKDPEYLIDVIMPAREIHLLGGSSGAGKSRWLFHSLRQWQAGNPVLGHASHPVPWIYVASDRSLLSVERTLRSMGVDPQEIPVVPAWDKRMSLSAILDAIQESKAKLAVIESFGSFVEPPYNSWSVKAFLSTIYKVVRQLGITVWGVVESPKMKPYERYENPRQRISGSASWGHFTETIFLVEPANLENPTDPGRILTVCPRNGAAIELTGSFDSSGVLVFETQTKGYRFKL